MTVPTCHPERKHYALGLCFNCYMRMFRVNHKGKKRGVCIECGKKVWKKNSLCISCSNHKKKGKSLPSWSEESRKKRRGENNLMWKGDNVGYLALHAWARRKLSKPQLCEKCKQRLPHDLANKSGLYKRDLDDWEWLCRKCHMESDGRNKLVLKNLKQYKQMGG